MAKINILSLKYAAVFVTLMILAGLPSGAKGDLEIPENPGLSLSLGRAVEKTRHPLSSFIFHGKDAPYRKAGRSNPSGILTRAYKLNLAYSGGFLNAGRAESMNIGMKAVKAGFKEKPDTVIPLQLRKHQPYAAAAEVAPGDKTAWLDIKGFPGVFAAEDRLSDLFKSIIGLGKQFPSTLCVLLDYIYGNGLNPRRVQDSALLRAPLDRNIFGTGLGYRLTPLIHLEMLGAFDFDENSAFLGPAFQYNLSNAFNLTAGVQVPSGRKDPAYGAQQGLYYAELKILF